MKVRVINKGGNETDYTNVASINDYNPNSDTTTIFIFGGGEAITIWKDEITRIEVFI